VILGFGIWILVDKTSFISVLQASSTSLKVGAYILVGVGGVTMLMGFLGCIGAVNEIRCLLGLYFSCLLLILIAQIAAGLLIYFQRDAVSVISFLCLGLLMWHLLKMLSCCGWTGPENWTENEILVNRSLTSYPCSCSSGSDVKQPERGFCDLETPANQTKLPVNWPVHNKGCKDNVQSWLQDNLGIILGVCAGVAVIELLGMVLSISLCKNIHTEDYTKVPKY
uniref:Tetraspanin n=1 Tax=Sphenodon punctatus TaxID=8508 RepID=A0A8D0G6H7_SPHPU